MGKRKRLKKQTVFIALEGQREKDFLYFLQDIFDPDKNININVHPEFGGTSNAILDRAIKSCHCSKVYAWFDEDDSLGDTRKEKLKKYWNVDFPNNVSDADLQSYNKRNCNPILIVSNPLSIEGILIRLFNKKLPKFKEPIYDSDNIKYNKQIIKDSINGIIGKDSLVSYYKNNLSKDYILEKAKDIKEIKLLLSMFNIIV